MKTLEGTNFFFGRTCEEISEPHGMMVRFFTDRNGIFSASHHECTIVEAGIIQHENFGKCVRITVKDDSHGISSWMRSATPQTEKMPKDLYEMCDVKCEEELIGRPAYCHFGFYTTLLTIIDPESYAGLILGYNVIDLM